MEKNRKIMIMYLIIFIDICILYILYKYRTYDKRNIMKYHAPELNRLNMTLPLAIFFLIFVSGCSTMSTSKNDPLEPMNRAIFGFNEVVDDNILKPVAKTHKYIIISYIYKNV